MDYRRLIQVLNKEKEKIKSDEIDELLWERHGLGDWADQKPSNDISLDYNIHPPIEGMKKGPSGKLEEYSYPPEEQFAPELIQNTRMHNDMMKNKKLFQMDPGSVLTPEESRLIQILLGI